MALRPCENSCQRDGPSFWVCLTFDLPLKTGVERALPPVDLGARGTPVAPVHIIGLMVRFRLRAERPVFKSL